MLVSYLVEFQGLPRKKKKQKTKKQSTTAKRQANKKHKHLYQNNRHSRSLVHFSPCNSHPQAEEVGVAHEAREWWGARACSRFFGVFCACLHVCLHVFACVCALVSGESLCVFWGNPLLLFFFSFKRGIIQNPFGQKSAPRELNAVSTRVTGQLGVVWKMKAPPQKNKTKKTSDNTLHYWFTRWVSKQTLVQTDATSPGIPFHCSGFSHCHNSLPFP